MARIIDDLLSLSRVESNEHIRPMGRVALPGLLNEIAELQRLQAEKRQVSIEITAPATLPDVRGEMDELIEVFRNLVDNAVKYCTPASVVSIRCHEIERIPDVGGRGIQVEVCNFGEPIPREHLPRLTERFYRVDKARSRDVGGTGLGLAIVKHIVNRHRGRLNVTSDAENGTVFTVMLPLYADPQKAP
jgi:two-component system phosphate regulon sensor histidine kinase PhoR